MRKHTINIIILLFLAIIPFNSGCKSVATKAEIKVIREHSNLCQEEIHKNWKYYPKAEQTAITIRFKSINKLFQAILKEKKKNYVTVKK